MIRTVHPDNRNSSSTNGSERCSCGGPKAAWSAACQTCWKSIPRALRQAYFESTPFSNSRRTALRTALANIRRK